MMRRYAVLLTAAVALGCRSSQPTTNPFLRTTVPPPGTGQGAVVMPGEPYYPGGAPPAMGAPVDPAAPPPPPPPLRNNKYSPPGGSFMYNQSSIERPKAGIPDGEDANDGPALASTKGARDKSQPQSLDELRLPSVEHAVEQATRLSVEPDIVELTQADGVEPPLSVSSAVTGRMPTEIISTAAVLEQSAASIREAQLAAADDTPVATSALREPASTATAVLRITAGTPAESAPAGSQLVVKQRVAESDVNAGAHDELAGDWAVTQRQAGASHPATRSSAWRASRMISRLGTSAL